jgi:glutathione S-transferase
MKLYFHPLSGHSHRARLFLSLLGVEHELNEVDLRSGAHKSAEFLRLNRFGQVPVLVDGETTIADSNAILVYLARKLGRVDWYPSTPVEEAQIQRWLSVSAGQIAFGPAAARLITVFGAKYDPEEVIARAHGILKLIDSELEGNSFILGPDPTIADVALYSYIKSAPEGNVDVTPYSNVGKWLARVEALPGFVPFQKTPVGLAATT